MARSHLRRLSGNNALAIIAFYKKLHCDCIAQRIALSSPSTKDCIAIAFYRKDCIVIPFYKGLHCDFFLQRIALLFLFTKDYIVIAFRTEDYIAIPLYKGLHCDCFQQTG